jgi:hypothetical protein
MSRTLILILPNSNELWFQNAINAKFEISELTTSWCGTNKVLGISLPNCNLIAQTILILWAKPKIFLMHFPVHFKLWLQFSRIHKNGFIAFWNQTLHISCILLNDQKVCRYNNDTSSRGDIFSEVSKTGIFLQYEMSRDIVLTSDFIRVRHIMLNVDLDRLKLISSGSVC